MDRENRGAVIAALCIILFFGLAAYWLPTVMLAAGNASTVLAAIVAIAFVLGFFAIFWLRSRAQRKRGK